MELVQLRKRRWIPVENPQRLIIKTGKHHDTLGCGRGRNTGLYECHVDAGVAIEQQSKIVNRPAANALLNDYSIASQYFDVSSCVLVVGARFRAGRENDTVGRPRLHELDDDPTRDGEKNEHQCSEPHAVAPGKPRDALQRHTERSWNQGALRAVASYRAAGEIFGRATPGGLPESGGPGTIFAPTSFSSR